MIAVASDTSTPPQRGYRFRCISASLQRASDRLVRCLGGIPPSGGQVFEKLPGWRRKVIAAGVLPHCRREVDSLVRRGHHQSKRQDSIRVVQGEKLGKESAHRKPNHMPLLETP